MLSAGRSRITKLYVGEEEYKKAYLGDTLVFGGSKKRIVVSVTGSSLSSLLSAGELKVAGNRITGTSAEIETELDEIEVSFELTRTISVERSVSVNGVDLGRVKSPGESVSTTLSVQDGMEVTIAFAYYIQTYTITASIDPAGSGTVTGAGQYKEGESATLIAAAADGYDFSGWQENGLTVSESETYTFTVTGDRTLTAVFEEMPQGRLPVGYTEIEYIEATGTQYIDTGVADFTNTIINATIEHTAEYSVGVTYLCGTSIKSGSSGAYLAFVLSSYNIMAKYASTQSTLMSMSPIQKVKYTFTASTKKFTANTASVTAAMSVFSFRNMYIFALSSYSSNGVSKFSKAKLYSFDITKSGSYIRQFVPCIDPYGDVGVYDLAEGKFYGNSGTGSFTAGPKV